MNTMYDNIVDAYFGQETGLVRVPHRVGIHDDFYTIIQHFINYDIVAEGESRAILFRTRTYKSNPLERRLEYKKVTSLDGVVTIPRGGNGKPSDFFDPEKMKHIPYMCLYLYNRDGNFIWIIEEKWYHFLLDATPFLEEDTSKCNYTILVTDWPRYKRVEKKPKAFQDVFVQPTSPL